MLSISKVLIIFTIVIFCKATSDIENEENTTYMYVFAQEWPGTVCKFETCTKAYMGNYDNARWNTHGLWPNTVLSTSCG